ncbi:MAG: VWA domain-containing protein [Betaproteobacteria bacterium]|jgi:uncharacterized membrane protein
MSQWVVESWWPALAFCAVLPLVMWLGLRSLSALGARHRQVLTLVRTLILAALAVALMQPAWLARSGDVSVVYALDVSRSVDPAFVDAAIAWMRRANEQGKPAEARFVAFADRVRRVDSPEAVRDVPVRREGRGAPDALDPLVTDLEGALEAIGGSFADDRLKRVVLMTDGLETRGDAWRAVERLRARQVRVFTVPATVRAAADVRIEGIDVPGELRRDEPAVVTVRLLAQAAGGAKVLLRRDGRVLGQQKVRLAAGSNRVAFTVRLTDAGAAPLTAEVAADGDAIAENDRLTVNAVVQARPRVLLAEAVMESARHARDALTAQGFDVRLLPPSEMPETAAGLEPYDAVIVSDAPASALGERRMQALEAYVRDLGGGLIYASGANAYGESGLRDSALERVLPATFEAQEKKRELALVITLDRSYSMKGRKLDLAKAATLGALALLEEEHRFGVITFDSQPEATVPLAPVRSRRKAEDLISRFTASGQTNIYPALQMSYRTLVDVPVKSKHVILLSDGDTQPADFQRLARRMADAGITVTTVAIGAEADRQLLENIATWGKGRFYFAESADSVPQIFVQETRRLVNENLREEPVRVVVKRKAEALRGIDFASAPALKGFVSTRPRDRAEVYLATEAGAPLLARWQVGLGKAMIFGSDLKNRWAVDWLAWSGYPKLWSQLVREVMRRNTREQGDFTVTADRGQAVVRLTALTPEGMFRNGLAPRVRVTGLGGAPVEVTMRQSGPGSYEVRVPLQEGMAERARFDLTGGVPQDLRDLTGTRELTRPYPDEFRSQVPDKAFLQALAEQTGGRYAPQPADVFASLGDEPSAVRQPLWPWFAAAALVLYLLDLFLRRAPRARRWFEPRPGH